jgi:hypothetical protein
MNQHYVEIELDGIVCAKRFPFAGKPSEEDARQYFREFGYRVGISVKFC